VQEYWQPQDMTPAALDAGRSIAARIVKALGGRGVFGVELMVRGDEVYFSDVTARPFESGLVTTRTQRLSEFELQARAILGLPVDTIMISPGAAEVIYTGGAVQGPQSGGALAEALRRPESDVRVFSHDDSEIRRPLGAAVVTAAVSVGEPLGTPFSAAPRLLIAVSIAVVSGGEGKCVVSAFIAVHPASTWL